MSAAVYTVRIPAPVKMISINEERNTHPRSAATMRKKWRQTAYGKLVAANFPRGLDRIRIDLELRFTSHGHRDIVNYHPTVGKPIVDAVGPERRFTRAGKPVVGLGRGVIIDDDPAHLGCGDDPHLRFGELVRADPRWPLGLVVLTITDLSGGAPCLR